MDAVHSTPDGADRDRVRAEAREVLARWDTGVHAVDRHGANSLVVLGSSVAVRVGLSFALGTAREAARCRAARRAGLPAPYMLAAGSLPAGPRYQVYRLMQGEPPAGAEDWQAVGRLLGVLHTRVAATPFRGGAHPLARRRHRYLRALAHARAIRLAEPALRCLTAARQDWMSGQVPVHGDVRAPNLLLCEGQVTGWLDWSDATLAGPASDWAGIPPEHWEAALRGYRSGGGRVPGHFRYLAAGHGLARVAALEAAGVLDEGSSAAYWRIVCAL